MKIRGRIVGEVSRVACNCIKVWGEELGLGANGLTSIATRCGAFPILALNSALKRINLYLFTSVPLVILSNYDTLPSSSIWGMEKEKHR